MRRISIAPREGWQRDVEALGFGFHTIDGQPYWREDAYYAFDAEAVDRVEAATAELHALCMEAVDRIVRTGRYDDLGIDDRAAGLAEHSWFNREPDIYGRMDLSWDGTSPPKLLEYNADTPTSLIEASIVQWFWLEARFPGADQFNSIHEKLIERWKSAMPTSLIHFAACYENPEDRTTTDYLLGTCAEAGHRVQALDVEHIGWNGKAFIDLSDRPIERLFKLYPWEWLLSEEFGAHIPTAGTRWIEPAWKMLLSNKAILPLLWQWFPNHPNLLAASRRRRDIDGPVVVKPYWGREGQGISVLGERDGGHRSAHVIYQALAPLPIFDNYHTLVGSWVVGGLPAGIGIREDVDRITRNTSCFIPHLIACD